MLYYKINHVVPCFKDKRIWFVYKYLLAWRHVWLCDFVAHYLQNTSDALTLADIIVWTISGNIQIK